MANTLFQFSCLYIVSFLLGKGLCVDPEFPMYVNNGAIFLYRGYLVPGEWKKFEDGQLNPDGSEILRVLLYFSGRCPVTKSDALPYYYKGDKLTCTGQKYLSASLSTPLPSIETERLSEEAAFLKAEAKKRVDWFTFPLVGVDWVESDNMNTATIFPGSGQTAYPDVKLVSEADSKIELFGYSISSGVRLLGVYIARYHGLGNTVTSWNMTKITVEASEIAQDQFVAIESSPVPVTTSLPTVIMGKVFIDFPIVTQQSV